MINWAVEYKNKKYGQWYENLIDKAMLRNWDKTSGIYLESHHIIPRSFGGTNNKNNLVCLTAREHYIAHAFLWKMKFTGVYNSKMAFAFATFMNKMQTTSRSVNSTYSINSKMYEVFKKQYSQMLKDKWATEGANFKGKKHTEESKRIIGEKSKLKDFKTGPDHPGWGKKQIISDEGKKAKRDSVTAMWSDPERRHSLLEKRRLTNMQPDVIEKRKKASDAKRGKPATAAQMKNLLGIADYRRGKTWEEIYTVDQLEIMKTASSRRVFTDEGKARLVESSRKVGQRPKSENFKKLMSERMTGIKRPTVVCEYCSKECVLCNYNRWHGDNCKHKI